MGKFKVMDHLRAAIALSVVVVCVVAALPMPGPGSRSSLNSVNAQQELQTWVELLANVGWTTDKRTLGEQVMWLGTSARSARGAVVDPFEPLFRITQSQQGWGLFAYPDVRPHRLIIEGRRRHGDYEVLYRSSDDQADWLASFLEYRRVRAMYKPGLSSPPGYTAVATEIARRLYRDYPDMTLVRVRFTRSHSVPPWVVPAPEDPDASIHMRVRTRRDVR